MRDARSRGAWLGVVCLVNSIAVQAQPLDRQGEDPSRQPAHPGDLQDSWGDHGRVQLRDASGSYHDYATSLLLDSGKILVGGEWANGSGSGFLLGRINRDGTPDKTFGQEGVLEEPTSTALESRRERITRLLALASGQVLAVGYSAALVPGVANKLTDYDIILKRYLPDGTTDESFGQGGVVRLDLGGDDYPMDLAQAGDGGIYIAGASGKAGVLIKLLVDGRIDPQFARWVGEPGVLKLTREESFLYALLVDRDGRVLVTGYESKSLGNPQIYVARFLADGRLDETFGTSGEVVGRVPGAGAGGLAVEDPSLAGDCAAGGIEILPLGKILVSGQCSLGPVLLRFNSDGTRDDYFGNGGSMRLQNTLSSMQSGTAPRLALQSDGKILLTGTLWDSSNGQTDFAVARFGVYGGLDASFGRSGVARAEMGSMGRARFVLVGSEGRILVGGTIGPPQGLGWAEFTP